VAEGGGLLNRYRVVKPYRGFESLRLRQKPECSGFWYFFDFLPALLPTRKIWRCWTKRKSTRLTDPNFTPEPLDPINHPDWRCRGHRGADVSPLFTDDGVPHSCSQSFTNLRQA